MSGEVIEFSESDCLCGRASEQLSGTYGLLLHCVPIFIQLLFHVRVCPTPLIDDCSNETST